MLSLASAARGWLRLVVLVPCVPVVYLLVMRMVQRSSVTVGPLRHPDEAARRRVVPHRPPGLSADARGT
jgi:hypothetical protein